MKMSHKQFNIGDHVYLWVKPRKTTLQTDSCAMLAPQFCGPFEILDRVGPVTYQLALPSYIKVHNVFHISLLKTNIHYPSHVVYWTLIHVELEEEFMPKHPHILYWKEIVLWNRSIALVKV